jgi:hypothetical protein
MSDVLMMALMVAAFAVAAAYVGLCERLARRPELLDEDQR